jgi:F-type H+-transporting ATPase subunit delta
VDARVQTAFALSDEQTKALQKSLSDAMGSHVTLNVEVNRDLLGGLIVTVGSRMIDDSVRRKLERLKRAMTSGQAA